MSTIFSLSVEMNRLTRDGTANPSRETNRCRFAKFYASVRDDNFPSLVG